MERGAGFLREWEKPQARVLKQQGRRDMSPHSSFRKPRSGCPESIHAAVAASGPEPRHIRVMSCERKVFQDGRQSVC